MIDKFKLVIRLKRGPQHPSVPTDKAQQLRDIPRLLEGTFGVLHGIQPTTYAELMEAPISIATMQSHGGDNTPNAFFTAGEAYKDATACIKYAAASVCADNGVPPDALELWLQPLTAADTPALLSPFRCQLERCRRNNKLDFALKGEAAPLPADL